MNISNVYEMYFSPTGNTKTTVECFSAIWKIPKSIIDLTDMNAEFDKYEFYSDDLCIIGVPTFGERVPEVALQRIKQTKACNTPAIIIVTYGNRAYGDTLIELQEAVESMGFCVIAALAVPTEHSIVHSFGKGRIDTMDRLLLKEMSNRVMKHIENSIGFNKAKVPANKEYKEYEGMQLKPVSTSRCVTCGICAMNCPVGAIPLDNPKVTDAEKCISCMRCIERCPKKARGVSRLKLITLAQKLKKECQARKDIEIFLNNNTVKEKDNDIPIINKESLKEADGLDMSADMFNIDLDMEFEDLSIPAKQEEQKEIINQEDYQLEQEKQEEIEEQEEYKLEQEKQEEIKYKEEYQSELEESKDQDNMFENTVERVNIEMEDIVDELQKAPEPEEIVGIEGVDVVDLEIKERNEIADEVFFEDIEEIEMQKIDVDIDTIRPDIEIKDDIGLKITDIAMLKKDEDGDGIDDDLLDNDAIFKVLYMTDINHETDDNIPVNVEDYDYESDVLFK